MNFRWNTVFSSVCMSTALLTSLPAAAQKPVELTYSSWLPASHVVVADFVVPWAKEVETATEGRVKIRILPKPVTNPVGHFDAVRNGVVDMGFISHSYYPGRFDLMKFAILPFSGNSSVSTSVAAWRIFDQYLAGANEHRGVKLLGIYAHGPGAVFTTERKVEKVEDFEGLKIRIGGGISADVAKALKVNAVVKPAPESYELLSTGVVDGVFFPPEAVASFRLDTLVKNATVFPGGLYADSHGVIMNQDAFKNLSETDQAILMKLSGEHIAAMAGKAWGDADTAALNSLKAKNVAFTQASDQLVADVKARTNVFEAVWLKDAKAKGIDGPKVLKAFRDELSSLEAGK